MKKGDFSGRGRMNPAFFCFIHRRGIRKGDRVGLKAQSAFEEGARFAPDFTGQPDPVDNRLQ